MAITNSDCLLLLLDLLDKGIDVTNYINIIKREKYPTYEVLEFLNKNRPLDITLFYNKLRESYNNKKSKLYINIVKNKFKDTKDIINTLNSLSLQICLFSKEVSDTTIFFNQSRLEEIYLCLLKYIKTRDLVPCYKLLNLIRADLISCEILQGRQRNILE